MKSAIEIFCSEFVLLLNIAYFSLLFRKKREKKYGKMSNVHSIWHRSFGMLRIEDLSEFCLITVHSIWISFVLYTWGWIKDDQTDSCWKLNRLKCTFAFFHSLHSKLTICDTKTDQTDDIQSMSILSAFRRISTFWMFLFFLK